MERVVFQGVSKFYKLGLTRSSIPDLVSQRVKRIFRPSDDNNFSRDTLWALKDVSFALKEHESLGLIGANGAGKTTILKLLSRITRPTAGKIAIDGKLSALIELGAGFHPDLTGRENIYLNASILGLKRKEIDRRFEEIVDFSEIERFIDTPVKRYSSGMAVRLGFSVAACIEPDILLVDEVLAVGDAAFRQKCINRIKTLLQNGVSLIFVSHSMGLLQAVCNTGLYLEHGRVKYYGGLQEAISLYDEEINQKNMRETQQNRREPALASRDGIIQAGDITITKVHVAGDENSKNLSSGDKARIIIEYLSRRHLGPVHFDVRIFRSDGLPCIFLKTSQDNFSPKLEQGNGVLTVTLDPLQLSGGMYYAAVTVKDEADLLGITMGWSKTFNVQGSTRSGSDPGAIFEPNRHWELQPCVDAIVK